jgi:hypothetical protein
MNIQLMVLNSHYFRGRAIMSNVQAEMTNQIQIAQCQTHTALFGYWDLVI